MPDLKVLDEVSTGDLLEELMNRCSTGCFIGKKDEGFIDGKTSWYQTRGSHPHCYGLIQQLGLIVKAKYLKEELRSEEDE